LQLSGARSDSIRYFAFPGPEFVLLGGAEHSLKDSNPGFATCKETAKDLGEEVN
jgi:hypothetical protein